MKLEFCFVTRLNPGVFVKPHSHNVLELVYYTEGRGQVSFDRRNWVFSECDFHITPEGMLHKQKNTEELCAICVGVSGSVLEEFSGTWHDHSGVLRYPLEQLVKELNAKEEGYELISNGLLGQIVGLTCRIIASQSSGIEAPEKNKKIDKALHIIRENEGRVSLDDISDTLYISKDYLRHLVSKSTGQSPLRHIISSRMEKAKRLLQTTDKSIGDIAIGCGFNDIYYFSRFFKRNAKLPPAAYRKRSQGKK